MTDLRSVVFNNLTNALENGYFEPGEQLHGATADEIAGDMIAYSADCETRTADDLKPHVEAWLAERRP